LFFSIDIFLGEYQKGRISHRQVIQQKYILDICPFSLVEPGEPAADELSSPLVKPSEISFVDEIHMFAGSISPS
jgi:hypothetical protein